MKCWICYKTDKEYYLLPERDNEFVLPKQETYEIKHIDNFKFLYYNLCTECFNIYIDNYPFSLKKIQNRELGHKSFNTSHLICN